tara:strand:+ start:115 stop:360 length:246 start_codon:yes stop_codon:yes gene_type:complete
MSNKKSYMSKENILSEGVLDKLLRKLKSSRLSKDKKIVSDLTGLNKNVLELEKELNKRFKELDPKHKPIKLSKYKLKDFIK